MSGRAAARATKMSSRVADAFGAIAGVCGRNRRALVSAVAVVSGPTHCLHSQFSNVTSQQHTQLHNVVWSDGTNTVVIVGQECQSASHTAHFARYAQVLVVSYQWESLQLHRRIPAVMNGGLVGRAADSNSLECVFETVPPTPSPSPTWALHAHVRGVSTPLFLSCANLPASTTHRRATCCCVPHTADGMTLLPLHTHAHTPHGWTDVSYA